MEPWQKDHITTNLADLIENTDFNSFVKAVLKSKDVLSGADISQLDAINKLEGKQNESSAYYDKLVHRKHAYEELTKALIQCRQSGPAEILIRGMESNGISKPLTHLQIRLTIDTFGEINVTVNQNQFLINDLFAGKNTSTIQQIFKESLPEMLYYECFVKQCRSFVLFDNTFPPKPSYYVPRFLSNRIILDKTVFKSDCLDIFVFKNTERRFVTQLASPNHSSTSSSQIEGLSSRFIYLERDDDWDKIVNLATVPAHLISFESEETHSWNERSSKTKFVLENTSGQSDILKKFGMNRNRIYMTEDEFVIQQSTMQATRGVCICDTPGMGKTLLLKNMARCLASKCPKSIVAFISLGDFFTKMERPLTNKNENEDEALLFVLRYIIPTPNVNLLHNLTVNDCISLKLFFDGFDEIQSEEVTWMKLLLKSILRKFSSIKIYIASRPHMKEELEKTFGVIAYNMLPFNEKNQTDFLIKFWSETLPTIQLDLIKNCVETCLSEVRSTLSRYDSEITGIPLQCRLIAKVYADEAKQFCLSGGKTFRFTSRITCEMYTEYVEKQINQISTIPNEVLRIKMLHTPHAIKLLFPQSGYLTDVANSQKDNEIILRAGIMQHGEGRNIPKLEFVHRTFAEYLVAEYFANYLSSHSDPYNLDSGIQFCTNNLLKLQGGQFVRNWRFEHDIVLYFFDTLLGKTSVSSYSTKSVETILQSLPPLTTLCMLGASSYQKFVHVFRFLKDVLNICENSQIRDVFTKERLFDLISDIIGHNNKHELITESIDLATKVFQYELTDICDFGNGKLPLLEKAFVSGNYEAFDYLFNKCPFSSRELVERCVSGTFCDDPDLIVRKVRILELILNTYPDTVSSLQDILFRQGIHIKLIKVLVEFGADTTLAKYEENFICFIIHHGMRFEPSDFHELVKVILWKCKAEYIFKSCLRWHDPLPCIFQNVQVLPNTIDMLLSIAKINICQEIDGENLLFLAVRKNNLYLAQELVKRGIDPKKRGTNGKSLLHLQECYENENIIEYLLTLGLDVNSLDENGNTPMRYVKTISQANCLIERGADLNIKYKHGQSVLHKAARCENVDLIKYFRTNGLNLNDRDHDGRTTLYYCNNERDSELLVELGAEM